MHATLKVVCENLTEQGRNLNLPLANGHGSSLFSELGLRQKGIFFTTFFWDKIHLPIVMAIIIKVNSICLSDVFLGATNISYQFLDLEQI